MVDGGDQVARGNGSMRLVAANCKGFLYSVEVLQGFSRLGLWEGLGDGSCWPDWTAFVRCCCSKTTSF